MSPVTLHTCILLLCSGKLPVRRRVKIRGLSLPLRVALQHIRQSVCRESFRVADSLQPVLHFRFHGSGVILGKAARQAQTLVQDCSAFGVVGDTAFLAGPVAGYTNSCLLSTPLLTFSILPLLRGALPDHPVSISASLFSLHSTITLHMICNYFLCLIFSLSPMMRRGIVVLFTIFIPSI